MAVYRNERFNQKYYRHTLTEPTKEDLLLESLCIPTQTEIRAQLGSKLADVFFENLSSEGRIILGLTPPLTGPDDLWINPQSRLKNKLRCKPVPEPQILHLKAFTHHAILEIGREHMESVEDRIAQLIQETLNRQALELEEEFKKRLKDALDNAKLEADEHCKQVVGTLMEHFDRCFRNVVVTNKLRMRKECQHRVEEERAELAAYMLVKLQEEIEKRDLELCSDFHDTLYGELNALAERYIKQIDDERKVAEDVLEDVVQSYETKLKDLKAEMEISSIVDVCRAVAETKARFKEESMGSQLGAKKQTAALLDWIASLKAKNKTLTEMATERSERIKQYREKMKLLIEEFQKFVNLALKAVPAHAEFLLSTQKMILNDYYEDNLLRPEDYEEYKNCLSGKISEKKVTPAPRAEGGWGESQICTAEAEISVEQDKIEVCNREKECKYAFNYYKYKYMLLNSFIKGIVFGPEPKSFVEPKKPCPRQSKNLDEVIQKQVEENEEVGEEESGSVEEKFKESLKLVGENMREHLEPIDTFLQYRMKALSKICRDNPEIVKMMLGCPEEKPKSKSSKSGAERKTRHCTIGHSKAIKPGRPCLT